MHYLKFFYEQRIDFSKPVHGHQFVYRCIPKSEPGQEVEQLNIKISPCDFWSYGWDTYQNRTIYGTTKKKHQKFFLCVHGIIKKDWRIYDGDDQNLYLLRAQTKLTNLGKEITKSMDILFSRVSGKKRAYEKALEIMNFVYETFTYTKGVTTVNTTAQEALSIKKGVCQDYAHVMIGLCRFFGISARYVSGAMIGEGYSHAWVEIYSDGKWYGFDPTNHLLIDDMYIAFARGRDSSDCILNQGVYYGKCQEIQKIKVVVEEIK